MSNSLIDVSVRLPSFKEVLEVAGFQAGYNTAVVVLGATLLGLAAGTIGCFAVLRKRALIGDALAHSALPGIVASFLLASYFGVYAKSLPLLLLGAAVSGLLGVFVVQLLSTQTRLTEEAAIGSVLSVFFGFGIVLLSVVQALPGSQAAGLNHFIYGQTASMQFGDAQLLALLAALVVLLTLALSKELRLLCFDPEFAQALGWSTQLLDAILLAILTVVTILGLQSVGILLVVALLIVPACAARFWTERLSTMLVLSAFFGAASGYLGACCSALLPRVPAGAVIVLTAGCLFALSLLFAPRRGVLANALRVLRLRLRITTDHVLRSMYEYCETQGGTFQSPVPITALREALPSNGLLAYATLLYTRIAGLLKLREGQLTFLETGFTRACKLVRNHRLWEAYIVSTSYIEVSHVDYSADFVEHALSSDIVEALEQRLIASGSLPEEHPPSSIHPLEEDLST